MAVESGHKDDATQVEDWEDDFDWPEMFEALDAAGDGSSSEATATATRKTEPEVINYAERVEERVKAKRAAEAATVVDPQPQQQSQPTQPQQVAGQPMMAPYMMNYAPWMMPQGLPGAMPMMANGQPLNPLQAKMMEAMVTKLAKSKEGIPDHVVRAVGDLQSGTNESVANVLSVLNKEVKKVEKKGKKKSKVKLSRKAKLANKRHKIASDRLKVSQTRHDKWQARLEKAEDNIIELKRQIQENKHNKEIGFLTRRSRRKNLISRLKHEKEMAKTMKRRLKGMSERVQKLEKNANNTEFDQVIEMDKFLAQRAIDVDLDDEDDKYGFEAAA